MGLRRQTRRAHFGVPEGIALVLLGITLGSGGVWWLLQSPPGWLTAPASVVSVSQVVRVDGSGRSRQELEVTFTYWVGDMIYEGRITLGPVRAALLRWLPTPARRLFAKDAYLRVEDLPEPFRELLVSRGITSFDRIPAAYLEAMRTKGYTAVRTFPEDFRRAVRNDDHAAAAAILDRVLPLPAGKTAEDLPAAPETVTREQTAAPEQEKRSVPPLQLGGNPLFHILYDPLRPSEHRVVFLPNFGMVMCILSFFLGATSSFVYCGWVYPRVKRWRA